MFWRKIAMPPRRGSNGSLPSQQQQLRFRASKFRLPVISLLLVSVATPLLFLAGRLAHLSSSSGRKEFLDGSTNTRKDVTKLHALRQIESLFPKEVVDVIKVNTDDSGPLSLNVKGRKDLSSSWVVEKPIDVSSEKEDTLQVETDDDKKERWQASQGILIPRREALDVHEEKQRRTQTEEAVKPGTEGGASHLWQNTSDGETDGGTSDKAARQQMRLERREKRATELTQHNSEAEANLEKEAVDRNKDIDGSLFKKYSIWRRDNDESDALVRLMRDQLIMARVYTSLANAEDDTDLLRELNARIKESRRVLGEANVDSDLPRSYDKLNITV